MGHGLIDQLEALKTGEMRAAAWPALLDPFITQADNHRQLIALHQRNQSAFEDLHRSERHMTATDDLEQQIRRLLASPDIPPATRVRPRRRGDGR